MINRIHIMINDVIKSLLQQANANGSRSNAIKPLLWLIGIFLPALITSSVYCPIWITIILAFALVIILIFFIFVYVYCLIKKPDLLRSEKFQLDKMVVEQTFFNQTKNTLAFPVNDIKKESLNNYQGIDEDCQDDLMPTDKKDEE